MKRLTINKRFLLVAIMGLIVPVAVLTLGIWREIGWSENSFTSDENGKRLDLAIRSLRKAPDGNWKPDYVNAQGVIALAGNDRVRCERLLKTISRLDQKLAVLTGERLQGRYYLDLDLFVREVKEADRKSVV